MKYGSMWWMMIGWWKISTLALAIVITCQCWDFLTELCSNIIIHILFQYFYHLEPYNAILKLPNFKKCKHEWMLYLSFYYSIRVYRSFSSWSASQLLDGITRCSLRRLSSKISSLWCIIINSEWAYIAS